jgi:hypothetical protein
MPSGYFRLNDWERSVALGHRHGVKVYPSLDESRVRDGAAKALRQTVQSYRGRAAAAWQAGADGVYVFNSFDPRSAIWRELGDMGTLGGLDKDYFSSVRGAGVAAGNSLPYADYVQTAHLNPGKPIVLKPGETARTAFYANETDMKGKKARLHVQTKNPAGPAGPEVKINGRMLDQPKAETGNWLSYELQAQDLHAGRNEVEITPIRGSKPDAWTDLRCSVRAR